MQEAVPVILSPSVYPPTPHLSRPTRHSLSPTVTILYPPLRGLLCQAGAGWQMAYTNPPLLAVSSPPYRISSPCSAPPVAQRRTRSVPFCLIRAWLISVASSRGEWASERKRDGEGGRCWWHRLRSVLEWSLRSRRALSPAVRGAPRVLVL